MFKTMFAETARTASPAAAHTLTPAAPGPVRPASPFGGNYVAVFDRGQAPADATGGHYTAAFDGPAGGRKAAPVDSYVAAFAAAGHPARSRRGSYTDAER
ncbi:hypothetical protein [Arthrobacter luteolus]|uniref:hypothetical protein n=1 Tax=Arthrobacter luteolus TaxID=98672 RepID=UPI0008316F82|nr:hypothetical protein [Arthrobacter luteolus]